jgi:hypothetical protein
MTDLRGQILHSKLNDGSSQQKEVERVVARIHSHPEEVRSNPQILIRAVYWNVDTTIIQALVEACPNALSLRDEKGRFVLSLGSATSSNVAPTLTFWIKLRDFILPMELVNPTHFSARIFLAILRCIDHVIRQTRTRM